MLTNEVRKSRVAGGRGAWCVVREVWGVGRGAVAEYKNLLYLTKFSDLEKGD